MKINRLCELGISVSDAKELRRLGIQVELLRETLMRETREMAAAAGDVEPPLTATEKRFQRLMDQIVVIINRYDDLMLQDTESGGFAVFRSSEALNALESGGVDACLRVPTVKLSW